MNADCDAASTPTRRFILVAGIAAGPGAEIASVFAGAGYDVLGLSRSGRCSARIRQAVEAGGGAYVHLACDLTQPAAAAHELDLRPFSEAS